MSLKIEVEVPFDMVSNDHAGTYLNRALSAIGFVRSGHALHTEGPVGSIGSGEAQASEGTSTSAVSDLSAEQADKPKRERGKPSEGRARRTKEEIAEDEEADKADAARAAAGAETGAEVADRQISQSPEDRRDPENEADAQQDAADEAAETAQQKEALGKKLTHDDARAALGAYVKAYGMPAALEDGPKVLTMLFGDEVTKVSAIPDDQESLAKAVAGINEMTAKNPFKRGAEL
jgi:hypothetical protein